MEGDLIIMLYKQYSSKEINGKILPKSRGSEIVQFSIQSRPGSRITINENEIESESYCIYVPAKPQDTISRIIETSSLI